MTLFGHHTEGFLQIEFMGRDFPDGMTEHVLAAGLGVVATVLMAYGAYAVVRDVLRWRRKRAARSITPRG